MSSSLICEVISLMGSVMQIFVNVLYLIPTFGGLTPPSVQSFFGSFLGCNL